MKTLAILPVLLLSALPALAGTSAAPAPAKAPKSKPAPAAKHVAAPKAAKAEEKAETKAEEKAEETAPAAGPTRAAGGKQGKIDAAAQETLDKLFAQSPGAKTLYGKAAGYAVFTNTRVAIGLTAGGGSGVAVNNATHARTYMKMGTGGVNVGLGAQKYQVVFLFETAKALDNFIEHGWQGGGSATAAAGKAGKNADTVFNDGVATYTMTDKGLMLSADLSGTKYWKNERLN